MTDLRTAAQQALEALEDWDSPVALPAMVALRAALEEPVLNPAPGYCKHCKQYTIEEPLPAEPVQEPCPNCASLEAQNTELDRKLAELEAAVLRSNGVDL